MRCQKLASTPKKHINGTAIYGRTKKVTPSLPIIRAANMTFYACIHSHLAYAACVRSSAKKICKSVFSVLLAVL